MAFAVGSNGFLAGIETAGTTTLNLSGGSGLPTGACCAGRRAPAAAPTLRSARPDRRSPRPRRSAA